jgi:tRNA(fMet)-specific endonuclease VapC
LVARAFQSRGRRSRDLDHRVDRTLARHREIGAAEAHRREVENFAARLEVLPYDAAAAHHAADIRARLERQGRSIGGYDVLIAGHARSRGLLVVTGNRDKFGRIEGLRCEDWG